MDEVKVKLLMVEKDLRSLADSIRALCGEVDDTLQEKRPDTAPGTAEVTEEKAAAEPVEEPAIPLEKVRGVLADKSRAGFTAEVRAIIQAHGAERLSAIDPKEYLAVLKEAEALK